MSVGNQIIDRDHQKLVAYLNEMHDAMMAGHGREIVGAILDKLVAYTKEHFGREEIVWKAGHYVNFAQHKKEHEDLLKTVSEFHTKYKAGTTSLSVDVMNFLRDWLKNHIVKSDHEAFEAIKASARTAIKPAGVSAVQ
jgi:hemerythrin-like metal-binding protein